MRMHATVLANADAPRLLAHVREIERQAIALKQDEGTGVVAAGEVSVANHIFARARARAQSWLCVHAPSRLTSRGCSCMRPFSDNIHSARAGDCAVPQHCPSRPGRLLKHAPPLIPVVVHLRVVCVFLWFSCGRHAGITQRCETQDNMRGPGYQEHNELS